MDFFGIGLGVLLIAFVAWAAMRIRTRPSDLRAIDALARGRGLAVESIRRDYDWWRHPARLRGWGLPSAPCEVLEDRET